MSRALGLSSNTRSAPRTGSPAPPTPASVS